MILITNDDGYRARGLKKLSDLMRQIGDVVVISTEVVMSAKGHSITTNDPLRLTLLEEEQGYKSYVINGTPVDCVKMGYQVVMDNKPDLVVSGINHGSNASVNVVYSGTMAAVVEACMDGIQAIGFSLNSYSSDADFSHVDDYVLKITRDVLENGLPQGVCLNVNIPKRGIEPIRGIKVCRQARAKWIEAFDVRQDPHGKNYYWLTGEFVLDDNADDADCISLEDNYVTVVPTQYDWTAYTALATMKRLENI